MRWIAPFNSVWILLLVAAFLAVFAAPISAQAPKGKKKGDAATRPREKAASKLPEIEQSAEKIKVAKVDPKTAERARLAAARIDSLVEANYAMHGVEPNPPTTTSSSSAGFISTSPARFRPTSRRSAFLDSKDADKRAALIDSCSIRAGLRQPLLQLLGQHPAAGGFSG